MVSRMNDPKEIKQKYAGCWLPLRRKESTTYGQLIDVSPNGKVELGTQTDLLVFDLDNPDYELQFHNPKTGFVYVGNRSDTYLILRKAEKQFKRGFHPDNYHSISLTKIAIRLAVSGATGISVNKTAQLIGNKAQEVFSDNSLVKRLYERTFPSLSEAIKMGHAVALSNRLAIVPSSNPKYDYDIFREAYKIGSLVAKDRMMTVSPLFVQELSDYVRRNNLDWGVTNASQ